MQVSLDHAVVNSFLRGLHYPISRDELVHLARMNRVPDELVNALQDLPEGHYGSQQEIMDHLAEGGINIT